ncbi:polyprenyl synthetase family protein [Clostridium ganghwense]|uniref:Polyprenyl synthetase family protein n=1 Tax=Clostridium ganghwense TaxID=312089 RepID=A0ABT4CMN5_9CLOT|nr:farnesyl diphosphate synthase [Clostridium ganghwense]MCY6370311.1 polyprenyl synthetase family protein [Clostridium ganghwense]
MEINKLKEEINLWLQEYFDNKGSYNKIIYDAMKYSIEVGGKRIRPILMICTYNIYKDNYKEIIPLASALEMIHTYSLIHDDLPAMDDDDLRRGKPTNHKVFGEAIAILAGDGLLNEAMNVLFDYCTVNSQKHIIEACRTISKASGVEGMIGGQVVDVISEGKKISEEQLSYMHSKKTGELIKSAIISGAILGEAKNKDIKLLCEFGKKLGLAFQIKDDILDIVGDSKILGKKINSDNDNDKITFVSKFGLEECKEMCKQLTNECLKILDNIGKDTSNLKDITHFLLKREF